MVYTYESSVNFIVTSRARLSGGNFWTGAAHGLMVAGLNHVAHSGLLGRGITIGLRSGYIRHWWKPDANTATAGIGVEASLTV